MAVRRQRAGASRSTRSRTISRGCWPRLISRRAHVVGLSLGGITAQAPRHPASAPGREPRPDGDRAACFRRPRTGRRGRTLVRERGMGAIADAVLARWFTPAIAPRPTPAVQDLQAPLPADRRRTATPIAASPSATRTCGPASASIRVPTLVVAGADDPVTTPEMGEDLARAIAGRAASRWCRTRRISSRSSGPTIPMRCSRLFSERGRMPPRWRRFGLRSRACEPQGHLGVEHVQRSMQNAGPFAMPWQDFITRAAWGEIWGDPTLPLQDALAGDAGHDGGAAPRGGVQAPCPPGTEERRHRSKSFAPC